MSALTSLFRPKRSISSLAAAAVVCAVVAVPLVNSPTAGASVYQSPGLVAGQTLSGVVNAGGQGTAVGNAFGNWRGAPITSFTSYTSTNSWANIDGFTAQGLAGYWAGSTAHPVWSVPLIPSDGSSTLEIGATGAYNSYFTKLAQEIVAAGDGNSTIRLGWEMTGNWFAWNGVKDPAAFAAAFRQAVTAMRAAAGQHFTFDFNPALGQVDPTPMYPGDAYVDIIGADTYDNSWAWDFAASDHAKVWNEILTENWGWNFLSNFAKQHGKPLSIPEWGVRYMCDGHGGGDDPYFIDQMRNFINTHDVAYENYFETDDNSCSRFTLTSGLFPNAAAEYQKDFSTAGQPQPAPPTTAPPTVPPTTVPPTTVPPTTVPPTVPPTTKPVVPPTTTPPTTKPVVPPTTTPPTTAPPSGASAASSSAQLEVSYYSNRSNWGILNRQVIEQNAYIFYPSVPGVVKVAFTLDGKLYHTESTAAWDLQGTAVNGANPLSPKTLSAGLHTLLATVTMNTGAVVKDQTTFFIASSAAKALTASTPSTSKMLRVSATSAGTKAIKLDGATIKGSKYILFSAVSGTARAEYILDGKVVRVVRTGARGLLAPLTTSGLHKGTHHLVIRMVSKTGQSSVASAAFKIA